MELVANFGLFAVGITVAGTGMIGFVAYLADPRSVTNRSFLFFSLATIAWSVSNYLIYQAGSEQVALWTLRIATFFAVLHAFTFFQLFLVFPNQSYLFSRSYRFLLAPLVGVTALFTLTPFVFSGIETFSDNRIQAATNGSGIITFGAVVVSLVLSGLFILLRRFYKNTGKVRRQIGLVLAGALLTFTLLLSFNFVFPAFLDDARFIPFGAVFLFPFVLFTSYAVYQHKLLNIKVVATEIAAFLLSVVSIVQVLFATSTEERVFSASVFVLVLVFSFLLVRSVIREIEARHEVERLAGRLRTANERLKELDQLKSEFLSIASHQLRSPLTSIKGYASMIIEGSFGKPHEAVQEAVQKIYESSVGMITSVEDYLNVSRIEQGKLKYEYELVDLSELAKEVTDSQKPQATKKGLVLTLKGSETPAIVRADKNKLSQILTNLVDNAIKYTPTGSVQVTVHTDKRTVQFSVRDTGVGVSKETRQTLFARFVRAKNASKVNVAGTGLGLYIAKKMVEAMNGRVWAESEGEGKGSTFIVELPSLDES